MMTLSSRSCAITVAVTEAPATVGAPSVSAGVAADREHVGEGDGRARLGLQLLDLQHRVRRHPVLLPAGADHCEHRTNSQTITGRQETRRPESGGYSGRAGGVNAHPAAAASGLKQALGQLLHDRIEEPDRRGSERHVIRLARDWSTRAA